jgi:hypothetical protein
MMIKLPTRQVKTNLRPVQEPRDKNDVLSHRILKVKFDRKLDDALITAG